MAEKDLWLRGYGRFCADPEGKDEPTPEWPVDERQGYRHALRLELLGDEDPRTLDPKVVYEALSADSRESKAVEGAATDEITFLGVFHDDSALYEIRRGSRVRVRRHKPGTLGSEISRLVALHGRLIWLIDLGDSYRDRYVAIRVTPDPGRGQRLEWIKDFRLPWAH